MDTPRQTSARSKDLIDPIALLSKLIRNWKFIVRVSIISVLIGVTIAVLTLNDYTASSMFTPNASSSGREKSGLMGLASLAGINIASMTESSGEISPMLYGKIVESTIFKRELLNSPLKNFGEAKTLRDYFVQNSSPTIFGIIKEYTLGLPSKILRLFKKEQQNSIPKSFNGIESVSNEDYEYFKIINQEILTLSINDRDGYIEMIARSKNPQLSAQIAKNAESILQEQIIAIKTKSSLELMNYLKQQYLLKKQLLNQAQNNLSSFIDRNMNISRSTFSNKKIRLESELNTANAVFQNVVTQLEQVKLQVAKDTPVFSIVKPVVVPNEKSGPIRSLMVLTWLFLGISVSTGLVLIREPVSKFLNEIQIKI